MTTDIIIPANLWDTDSEAVITTWFAKEGQTVEQGTLLAEIMVKKIQYEIKAPASGSLNILKPTDDIIDKGDCIGRIT